MTSHYLIPRTHTHTHVYQDCNDNAPEFTKTKYVYNDLQEEDHDVPKYLLTVTSYQALLCNAAVIQLINITINTIY